jgi:hypothetical protein
MRPFLPASAPVFLLATLSACSGAGVDNATASSAALSTDAGSADVSLLTFREIGPILARTCGTCHDDEFAKLADVKKDRELMIRKIEDREMPADDQDDLWLDSAEGQAVLKYLKTSPELR